MQNLKKNYSLLILIIAAFVLGACSNNQAPVNSEAPVVEPIEATQVIEPEPVESPTEAVAASQPVESSAKDFSHVIQYTQQPPAVDPATGYFLDEIADGVYWLSGSFYQAMFITTGEGVIAVDAPQSIGRSYLDAIQSVTDEPVTHVIYSHSHPDHIGSAGIFPPEAQYIAHQDTVSFLSGVPAPTITFDQDYTLEVGNQVLELSYIGTAHSVGDSVIYAPKQKVIMFVDLFHPASAPFGGFGATVDMNAHLQAHDTLLAEYDFNLLVPGHTEILGTKAHVETNKAFALSVQDVVQQAISSGSGAVIQACVDATIEQWSSTLANVADRAESNCRAMERHVMSQEASMPEPTEAPIDSTALASNGGVFELPERAGARQVTSGVVPHVQFDIDPVQAVNDELFRRAYLLPGVEDRPTMVSLPGGRGMWLNNDIALANPNAIVAGREFAHIHTDGSLHAPLPLERALEVDEKKWGERHPWAEQRDGFDGFVMLYTPLTMEELDVTFQLIVESYNHVTGQNVQAADFR